MSTNTGWKHAYQGAVTKLILAKGDPVRVDESTYGWVDYEFLHHLRGRRSATHQYPGGPCEIVLTDTTVYQTSISEFTDTEHSNDYTQVAELRGCECACGARKDFTMRFRGSLTDVLSAIEVLDGVAPDAVVPADEVDTMISIQLSQLGSRLSRFQTVIQNLADVYFNTAQDSDVSPERKAVLEAVANDLNYALKMSVQ